MSVMTEKKAATCSACDNEIFYNAQVNVWQHAETHSAVCGSREQLNYLNTLRPSDPAYYAQYATPCVHCVADDCVQHGE